jgi:hypothetical protein
MAEQTSELSIVIEAINKASATIKQVGQDLDGLSKEVKKDNSAAQATTGSFNNLLGAFVGGALIVKGIEKAFQFATEAVNNLRDALNESVQVAASYESTMLGLDSVAVAFGHDVNQVRDAAMRLSKDGLLTPAQSAEALKNILAGLNGVTIEQAESMVMAMKDTASFNRVLTDYGDAIIQTTRGMRNRNSILTDSAGVQKNLQLILQESGYTLQDLDSASKKQAATQALINGYMKESKFAYGDAQKYLETYLGAQTTLNATLLDVKKSIGEGVMPAFQEMKSIQSEMMAGLQTWLNENKTKIQTLATRIGTSIRELVEGISEFINRNKDIIYAIVNDIAQKSIMLVSAFRMVGNSIQIIGNGIEFMVRTIVAGGKVLSAAIRGDWEGIVAAGDEWLDKSAQIQKGVIGNWNDLKSASSNFMKSEQFDIKNWWAGIAATEKEAREMINADAKKSNDEKYAEDIKTLKKLADETKKYNEEVAKRTKAFEESFDDLVMAHRDAIKKLTDDLTKENKDYNKKVLEMESDYKKAVEDMAKDHKNKTASILEDIEDERKKTLEAIEEITEKYNEERTLVEREGEARLSDLQAQLDRELALGDKADQSKIEAIRKMIQYEKDGLNTSLEEQKAKYDEQIDDENEKLNERLTKLQASLEEENTVYAEAMAERKATYDKDVADAKESYEERRIALQTELDNEVSIREKYAEDFKRIGDTLAEDDLTRLVRKHEEELAEMKKDHEEKLAELKGEGVAQGEAFVSSYTAGMQKAYPQFKSQVDQITNDLDSIACKTDMFSNSMFNFSSVGVGQGGGGGGGAWARGGIITKPTYGLMGEAGAEAVLPLSNPKRMEEILRSIGKSQSKREVIQNFYVTVTNQQDVDVLMERAGFAYENGGFN